MNAIDLAVKYLEPFINSSSNLKEQRLDIFIEPENLKEAVKALVDRKWGYLIAITGLDIAPIVDEQGEISEEGKIEGLYHFASGPVVLTLKVKVPYSNPRLDSICELIPSATLYEREFIELFGVELAGTPDERHLILPDCWPENVYPLRKSFTGLEIVKS
jgi:Ni,Fe-hydrogenase III component G